MSRKAYWIIAGLLLIFGGMVELATHRAHAKGCLKGAIVGGIAGHLVHHGWAGAAAGCVIGHHEAEKDEHRREHQYDRLRHRDVPQDGY